MFTELFYLLRRRGVAVAPQEWFAFLRGLAAGLAREGLLGLYYLARATLVKSETLYDDFDVAFAEYFRSVAPLPPEIADAIERWLREGELEKLRPFEGVLSGIDPHTLEELMRRFEEKLREQKERHDGGSEFIGTQGTSPFGRLGRNPAGIRIGPSTSLRTGEGGGARSAVKVAEARLFRDYRSDRTLDIRQLRVALKKLRELAREDLPPEDVDLPGTVEATGKNAGEIEIVWERPRKNRVKLLLLMDVGGSMEPYAELVERLFSAASQSTHWKSFEPCYFHNCVYANVYGDAHFGRPLALGRLLKDREADWKVVLVGDACMASSELFGRRGAIDYYATHDPPGIDSLRSVATHFRRCVWLNPMRAQAWDHPTVRAIGVLFPMFELTIDGLERSIKALKVAR